MSQSVITFTTPSQFTASDSDLIEVASNVGRLKTISYTNELTYASYIADVNSTRISSGGLGTAVGATIASNKLNLKGGTLKYVSYVGAEVANITTIGTFRNNYIPNYTGNPSTDRYVWSLAPAGGFTNVIHLFHKNSDGKFQLEIFDTAGGSIISATTTNSFSATTGVAIDIELDMDLTGTTRLFINGVPEIVSSDTGSRNATDFLYIGTNRSKNTTSNCEVEFFQIFSTVQHTTAFTPSAKPTTYDVNNPTLLLVTGIGMDELTGFDESITISGSDVVKYVLNLDGTDKYWDGAAWSTSSSYSQSNTATEIETNKADLGISLGATIKPKVYLHSEFGETTPTITSMTIDYDFFAAMIPETSSKVYGYVRHNLSAITSVTGFIRSSETFFSNGNLISVNKPMSVNSNGYFEIDVPRTSEELDYKIEYTFSGTKYVNQGKLVANVAEIELEDAIV